MSQYFIKVKSCATTPNVEPEYWSKQIVSPTQENLFYNSGSIGIGVPNPLAKLHIDGNVGIGTQYSTINPPINGCIISGSVGIGTTNPTEKLHVFGNTKIQGNLEVTGTQTVSGIDKLEITTTGADTSFIVNQNGTGDIIDIKDSGASVLFVKNGGFVGIGTANPTEKLHVIGNAIIEGDLTVNGTQTIINTETQITDQLIIENAGTGSALIVNQTGNEPVVEFKDDGNTVFKIVNDGFVGIGTTLPAQRLDVNGNTKINGYVHMAPNALITPVKKGVIEYNEGLYEGNFFATTNATNRGIITTEKLYVLNGTSPKLNAVGAQQVFPPATIAVNANTTYRFKSQFYLVRTAGTTAHTISIGLTSTAVLGTGFHSVGYTVSSTVLNGGTSVSDWVLNDALTVITSSVAVAEQNVFILDGIIRIAAAGFFNIVFSYSAAPGGAPTIQPNAYISLTPIGTFDATDIGS